MAFTERENRIATPFFGHYHSIGNAVTCKRSWVRIPSLPPRRRKRRSYEVFALQRLLFMNTVEKIFRHIIHMTHPGIY